MGGWVSIYFDSGNYFFFLLFLKRYIYEISWNIINLVKIIFFRNHSDRRFRRDDDDS